MHQSDHISPSKSGLDLHLLPAYPHVTSNYTEWFPSSAIYSSLSCYLLCPLFQIPFPPPLPLRPYPLWHPSLIFKATFKHSFLVRLISLATGGLLRTLCLPLLFLEHLLPHGIIIAERLIQSSEQAMHFLGSPCLFL